MHVSLYPCILSGRNGEESIPMIMRNHTAKENTHPGMPPRTRSPGTEGRKSPRQAELTPFPDTPQNCTEITGQYRVSLNMCCGNGVIIPSIHNMTVLESLSMRCVVCFDIEFVNPLSGYPLAQCRPALRVTCTYRYSGSDSLKGYCLYQVFNYNTEYTVIMIWLQTLLFRK